MKPICLPGDHVETRRHHWSFCIALISAWSCLTPFQHIQFGQNPPLVEKLDQDIQREHVGEGQLLEAHGRPLLFAQFFPIG